MNRKIILLVFFFSLIIGYFWISASIGNTNSILDNLKKFIPVKYKTIVKEYLFSFQNQKQLKIQLEKGYQDYKNLIKKTAILSSKKILFEKDNTSPPYSNLIKFNSNLKENILSRRAFIEFKRNRLYLISGFGNLYFADIKNFEASNFTLREIPSNFFELLNYDNLLENKSIVNDMLIKNNQIFISYTSKDKKNNCYKNSLVFGDLNLKYINFSKTFETEKCLASFFSYSSGGAITDFEDNTILLTIGDYDPYSENEGYSQSNDDMRGKIVLLDIKDKKKAHQIVGLGLRNSQGIHYNNNLNKVFFTDHGPIGGDEINVLNLENSPENFGWPVASYGKHYDFPFQNEDIKKNKLKFQPLLKNHSKNGFKEPIRFWVKSNPPTKILSKFDKEKKEINLFVSTLGKNQSGDTNSIQHYVFDQNFKEKRKKIYKLNQRIRDMVFDQNNDIIIFFMENTFSIGFLKI